MYAEVQWPKDSLPRQLKSPILRNPIFLIQPVCPQWMETKLLKTQFDACEEVGIDITDHMSAGLTRASLQEASIVFCMTESHRALINMYFELPEGFPIFLMREFIDGASKELPDPYGQDIEVYRECRDRMIEAIPSLINWVEKNL